MTIQTANQPSWWLAVRKRDCLAARLNQLGIDNLVVEKWPRIGDSWRKRYHSLALHNSIHVNNLPYLPFPPTWPNYIPKDMLGMWFEFMPSHGDQ